MRWACGRRGDPSTVIAMSAGGFYALVALLRHIARLIRAGGEIDLTLIAATIDKTVGRDPGESGEARR